MSRSEIDAKKLKEYWNEAAVIFMSDDPRLDDMPGTAAQRVRYAEKGLSATYSDYVIAGEVAETKFKDMRRQHMAVLVELDEPWPTVHGLGAWQQQRRRQQWRRRLEKDQ